MDGQRRVARTLNLMGKPVKDCGFGVRVAARCAAVAFLGLTIFHGLLQGGHLNYPGSTWMKIPGKLAGVVGLAAEDIRISGLEHHDPAIILGAIGVRPGGTLVGFDAAQARIRLESMDWVESASVQRLFPNQLEIDISERQPFAVWQHNGSYSVIDKSGVPMSGIDPATLKGIPLLTGEGANIAAAEFVNQLEATPQLKMKVYAAARVGKRRWTLYLDNGIKVALPEQNVPAALEQTQNMDMSQGILSKGIRELDMRVTGQVVVALAAPVADAEQSKPTGVSGVQ